MTPEAKFYSDEVHFVVVPGSEGEMCSSTTMCPLVSTRSRTALSASRNKTKAALQGIPAVEGG